MAKRFKNYQEYAAQLKQVKQQMNASIKVMLLLFCEVVEKDLHKNIIGRTMPLGQTGTFSPWPPLKDETIRQKAKLGLGKGGNPRSMLYASGALDESYEHTIQWHKAIVGTNEPYAAAQEYGSAVKGIPPRPSLGPATYRAMEKLQKVYSKMLSDTLEGKHPRLHMTGD